MISRVAEHCYWLSRYLERAENTARLLDVNQTLLLDFDVPMEQQWRPLLIISGLDDYAHESDGEAVQRHMTWETDNPSSIASSLAAARENGRIIREVISADMWERLNYYYLWFHSPTARLLYERGRSEFYNQIKRINQLFQGITDGTMSHGEPWEFLQLGFYLERAGQTARILDVKYHMLLPTPDQVGTPIDNAHWIAILMSCSGYEPFHKMRRPLEGSVSNAVADFLIHDPLFPRSVRRCLAECQVAIHALSGRSTTEPGNDVERKLASLIDWVDERSIEQMVSDGLHESLTYVVDTLHEVAAAAHTTYFDVRDRPPVPGDDTVTPSPGRPVVRLDTTRG